MRLKKQKIFNLTPSKKSTLSINSIQSIDSIKAIYV